MNISNALIDIAIIKIEKDSEWRNSDNKKYLELVINELKSQYYYLYKTEEFWDLVEMAVMERLLELNTAGVPKLLKYYEKTITAIGEDVFIKIPFDNVEMAFNREKLKTLVVEQFKKRRG